MLKDRIEQWMKDNARGSVYQVMDELNSSRSHTTKVLNDLVQEGKIGMVKGCCQRGPSVNIYTAVPPRRTFKQRFMEMLGLQ